MTQKDMEEILEKIEELREKMHKTAEVKGLADPETVVASQMLNAVLNEYYRLMKKKMEPPE